MKRVLEAAPDLLGAACVVYGVSLVSVAAAWVVAGLIVIVSGLVPRGR